MKAISLFSGIGGFDLGFERAGIETVLQVEQDKACLALLQRHWPDVERMTDVRSLFRDAVCEERTRCAVGDCECAEGRSRADGEGRRGTNGVDFIYGGFPCQDVSVAGRRAGLDGERSGLWFEFHRILRELRPRWVCIENVAGLLSSNSGRDFGVILSGLDELGFHVAWAVLDAQHFGVPQRRRRVFLVGGPSRRGAEQVLSLCESCGGNPAPSGEAGERIADTLTVGANQTSGFIGEPVEAIAVRTANTSSNGWGVGDTAYTLDGANGQAVLASTVRRADWKGSYCGDGSDNLVVANPLGNHHRRDDLDHDTYVPDVVGTLSDGGGMNGQDAYTGRVFAPGNGVRRLTPLECERLQGFPDGWTDGQADSHRYRQLGNAVAVPVAEWIGHRLVAVDRMER